MNSKAYRSLAIVVGIHFFIMYALVFASVNVVEDIKLFNLRNLYKALLMVTPMIILMVYVMGDMYENRRVNMWLYAVSAVVFIVTFFFVRQQVFVGNEQFIKSMIPHHSSAITMCQEADITDRQLNQLCDEIIQSQQQEIDEMNRILDRLENE